MKPNKKYQYKVSMLILQAHLRKYERTHNPENKLAVLKQMNDLKLRLKTKFGNAINLENDPRAH